MTELPSQLMVKYVKKTIVTLSQQLQEKYGSSFEYSNVIYMIKFVARFSDLKQHLTHYNEFVIMKLSKRRCKNV